MKNDQKEQIKMLKVLDWSYEKCLDGLPGTDTAIELAESYLREDGTLIDKVNSLIRWQISKTTTSGFLSGLGGLMTLPVAIPANVASVVYVQMRMIAAIAHMGGYDIKDDQVKGLVYVCLAGNEAKDILKNIGIQFGTRFSKALLKKYVTRAALTKINQAVEFRLITKFGTTGVINLGKAIPLIGGVIGGSFDGITTNTIGNVARDCFILPKQTKGIESEVIIEDDMKNANTGDIEKIINLELQRFYSYINLIKIDGKIADEEVALLENFINVSDLSDNQKMEIIGKIYSSSMIDVDYSVLKEKPDQGIMFVNNLVSLSKIDGQVHPTEKMFIKNVAKQLEIQNEDILELLNK